MLRTGFFALLCLLAICSPTMAGNYPIVDTGQTACFDNSRQISCPEPGEDFNGQDGQYKGNQARYDDNGDGTVSDRVTGLMWVKARGEGLSWRDAMKGASECRVGGYDDWRMPTIKELYSLIDFNGRVQQSERDSVPYIDTDIFDFTYGDTTKGQRIIDCQDWSSTKYVSTTMGGAPTVFGVNFGDGRIKGYPTFDRGRNSKYVRYVRGNPKYGMNDFKDNGDGTITDRATSLIWQKTDDGTTRNWEEALGYCENLDFAGRTDWRLPSAKELQSIVDYSRSPKTTNSAAIDPIFSVSNKESYFWSSTTHLDGPKPSHACYVAFGRALGYFAPPGSGQAKEFIDVHGAGAQRSDPKSGNPAKYPTGHGPQGDDIRINNAVRCVAGGSVAYYEPPNERIPAWKGGRTGQRQSGMGSQRPSGMRNDPNMGQGRNTMPQRPMMQNQDGMQGQGMQGRRGGPPQEAFDACESKSQGDACTVETPRGTLKGMCRTMPEGTVCVPEGHRPGRPPMQ